MFRYIVDNEVELRILEERHADALWALMDRNRAHLKRWMQWVDDERTVEDTRVFIRRSLTQFAENNGMQTGVWYKGEIVGTLGFHYYNWTNRNTEIGYWLGEAFEGHGIMTRAVRALLRYAFDELGLNRVEIRCEINNTRSRAIPQRLGFTQEGVLREVEALPGGLSDQVVYSLLAREWRRDAEGAKE